VHEEKKRRKQRERVVSVYEKKSIKVLVREQTGQAKRGKIGREVKKKNARTQE